jgi:cobalt-zinc-cadmium efflux system protein
MDTHANHQHRAHLAYSQLRLAFFLTILILVAEVAGGAIGGSLALLSDAGHAITDIFTLGLAWFAAAQAERPANASRTFGYHRIGILAALLNALLLILIAIAICFEAYRRFLHPSPVQPLAMFAAAGVGVLVNLYIAFALHGAGEQNLNLRSAALHVLGDLAGSAGVILAGLIILFTGITAADPAISVLIALLIAFGAVRIIRETLNILLEATPRGIPMSALVRDMLRVPGIRDVHDLHVWSISSGMHALSCHAVIDDLPPSASAPILDRLTEMLEQRYHINHATIQFESTLHSSHLGHCACQSDALYCALQDCQHDATAAPSEPAQQPSP